jgi:hypothetical protein
LAELRVAMMVLDERNKVARPQMRQAMAKNNLVSANLATAIMILR